MKIGQVTWYQGNYGSALQAIALQKAVEMQGHDCEIVRICEGGVAPSRKLNRLFRVGLRKSLRFYLEKLMQRYRSRNIKTYIDNRSRAVNSFVCDSLNLSDCKYKENSLMLLDGRYDAFMCGSDQIWNPALTIYSDFYWLNFTKSTPKFSYAPSLGVTNIDEIDRNRVFALLRDYSSISVREEAAVPVLRELAPVDVESVLDPTLLFDGRYWISFVDEFSNKSSIQKKYLFAYLLRGNPEQAGLIEDVAKQLNLELVVYPYLEGGNSWDNGEWGDVRLFDDTPADMLARIKDASLVITDSFHCSVFSILFHKNFRVLRKANDSTKQIGRLLNLLRLCDLEDALLAGEKWVDIDIDYSHVDGLLDFQRRRSWDYLKRALLRCQHICSGVHAS